MKAIRWILAIFAAVSLSGCFTAKTPLVTDENAVAPYARISFATTKNPDDWKTLPREGKAYVGQDKDGKRFELRLRPFDDNFYLAQASASINGQDYSLYAFVKVAEDKKTAVAYRAIADVKVDAGSGLAVCKQGNTDVICIEDVGAYLQLAKAAEKAGRKDMEYLLKLE